MKVPLAILLAAERSGTHFFRSIINENKSGCAYWEVVNSESQPEAGDPLNFFSFRKSLEAEGLDVSRPTVDVTRRIIDKYFDRCIEFGNTNTAPLIIDIKYGHLINFTNGWWDFHSPPLLFEIAREREIPFIHLRRKSLYKTALSDLYASQTNLWKVTESTDGVRPSVQISREALEQRKNRLGSMMSTVQYWLQENISYEVFYEDLNDPQSVSWTKLSPLLAKDVTSTQSEFKRVLGDYPSQIQNYAEISDLID